MIDSDSDSDAFLPSGPVAQGRSVLIVVDDAYTRRGIRRLLVDDGYEVASASGLTTAAALARDFAPDAVLISMGVEPPDGIATAGALGRHGLLPSHIPYLILVDRGLDGTTHEQEARLGPSELLVVPGDFAGITFLLGREIAASVEGRAAASAPKGCGTVTRLVEVRRDEDAADECG